MTNTREQIITNMCYTFRHDYGLTKDLKHPLSSGMTDVERTQLWNSMAQIFDNDILPNMDFKKE